jgi:hypothetical protein
MDVYTILRFQYDNTVTKTPGKKVDITINDLQRINDIGAYINKWIIGGSGLRYTFSEDDRGTNIQATYLTLPAENIYDTAVSLGSTKLPNSNYIKNLMLDIIDNVKSGAYFKASYFNNMALAINSFDLTMTY